jgi:hypothetical protein
VAISSDKRRGLSKIKKGAAHFTGLVKKPELLRAGIVALSQMGTARCPTY